MLSSKTAKAEEIEDENQYTSDMNVSETIYSVGPRDFRSGNQTARGLPKKFMVSGLGNSVTFRNTCVTCLMDLFLVKNQQ